jgi:DNA-binding transcriptional regulator YhcF (GntR family)
MITKIQQELATEQIVAFFEKMKELGYNKEEIITLLQNATKEEK